MVTKEMIERFLTWPLPESVCADLCATQRGRPHRTGTNLLSADEARQMLEHVLLDYKNALKAKDEFIESQKLELMDQDDTIRCLREQLRMSREIKSNHD